MSEVTAQHSKLGWWILAGLWATAPDSLESWPAAANHAARLHSSGGRAQSYQRSARPQFWVGAVDQEDSATKRLRGYRTLLRCGCSHYEQPATACTPLGAPASRLPSYTRAVEPGSVSVGVTYMQPASGLFDVPHIHQRLGATNIEATKPFPVEAVAQNQYHCPGSSSWDVSGDVAGRTGWTSLTEGCGGRTGWRGGRLKSAGCEIGGVVVPRTEDEIPS